MMKIKVVSIKGKYFYYIILLKLLGKKNQPSPLCRVCYKQVTQSYIFLGSHTFYKRK